MSKFVYAPFTAAILHADTGDINTGFLESPSKIDIVPQFVGNGADKRYVCSTVTITCNDAEASFDSRNQFLTQMNKMFTVTFFFHILDSNAGSIGTTRKLAAGFTEGPFRYTFYPENIPNRGMRWVHVFSADLYFPGWMTFLDFGWKSFLASLNNQPVIASGGA